MCPREKQTRKIGFMSMTDFAQIIHQIPFIQGQMHLHGYGEPLLDKQLNEKIKLAKAETNLTTFIITTLGVEMDDEQLEALLATGLDTMMISFYGATPESYKSIHRVDKLELVKKNLRTLAQLKASKGYKTKALIKISAPSKPSPLTILGKIKEENEAMDEFIHEMNALGYQLGAIERLHNYGNGRTYNPPRRGLCPVINGTRKGILNITWDLNVIPCCFDFNASIIFGNLKNQTLEEIFNGEPYKRFVTSHLEGDLSAYPVCQNCEKIDYQ